MDKIYAVKTMKTDLKKEDILALLSGEEYKTSSDVWREDTKSWLMGATGRAVDSDGFSQFLYNNYVEFEFVIKARSKECFKKLGFAHWSEMSKQVCSMIIILAPTCYILISIIANVGFTIINWFKKRSFQKTINNLEMKEKDIQIQLDSLKKND